MFPLIFIECFRIYLSLLRVPPLNCSWRNSRRYHLKLPLHGIPLSLCRKLPYLHHTLHISTSTASMCIATATDYSVISNPCHSFRETTSQVNALLVIFVFFNLSCPDLTVLMRVTRARICKMPTTRYLSKINNFVSYFISLTVFCANSN